MVNETPLPGPVWSSKSNEGEDAHVIKEGYALFLNVSNHRTVTFMIEYRVLIITT